MKQVYANDAADLKRPVTPNDQMIPKTLKPPGAPRRAGRQKRRTPFHQVDEPYFI